MSSLRQLLETVGTPLLECVVPAAGLDEEVSDVLAHDPTDPPDVGRGDLVLAIGIASEEEVAALARQVKEAGAAGLVLRSHVLSDEQVESLGEIGVSLLTVPR